VTITTPGVRPLVAVADPDGQIPEDDETDNLASVSLADARTLEDAGAYAIVLEGIPLEVAARITEVPAGTVTRHPSISSVTGAPPSRAGVP